MEKGHKRQPQVVIIGAGFGGLEAAKKLACKDVRLKRFRLPTLPPRSAES